MKLGDALGYAGFAAIAGTCVAVLMTGSPSDYSPRSTFPTQEGETVFHASEAGAASAALVRSSSGAGREDHASEVPSVPVGLGDQGSPGDWVDLDPPAFTCKAVKAFVDAHPNNPLKFTPASASQDQVAFLEHEAEAILSSWERERDRLHAKHGDNLLAFCEDPDVIANDKDRVTRLKSLVLSLWPDCGLEP